MKPQTSLFSALILFLSLLAVILICKNTAVCQEIKDERIDIPTFQGQDNFTLSPASDCAQHADRDIENGEPRLIICYRKHEINSGAALYANQHEFEEKYGITYKLYNCTVENEKCVENYNKQVLKHLHGKFGRKWKKEVREDVYGLK